MTVFVFDFGFGAYVGKGPERTRVLLSGWNIKDLVAQDVFRLRLPVTGVRYYAGRVINQRFNKLAVAAKRAHTCHRLFPPPPLVLHSKQKRLLTPCSRWQPRGE